MTISNSIYPLTQSISTFSDRFTTLIQNRSIAISTLVITSLIAVTCAALLSTITFIVLEDYAKLMLLTKMKKKHYLYSMIGLCTFNGLSTFIGVSVGLSKLLKLPFSSGNILAISIATIGTIALGFLWKSGLGGLICQTID